jgi:hypothetical protein
MNASSPQRNAAFEQAQVVTRIFQYAYTDMLMDRTRFPKRVKLFLWVRWWRLVTISGMARGSSLRSPHKLIPRLSFVYGFLLDLSSFFGLG